MNRRKFLQAVAYTAVGMAGYKALDGYAADGCHRVAMARGVGGAAVAQPGRLGEALYASVRWLTEAWDGWQWLLRRTGTEGNTACEREGGTSLGKMTWRTSGIVHDGKE